MTENIVNTDFAPKESDTKTCIDCKNEFCVVDVGVVVKNGERGYICYNCDE